MMQSPILALQGLTAQTLHLSILLMQTLSILKVNKFFFF